MDDTHSSHTLALAVHVAHERVVGFEWLKFLDMAFEYFHIHTLVADLACAIARSTCTARLLSQNDT